MRELRLRRLARRGTAWAVASVCINDAVSSGLDDLLRQASDLLGCANVAVRCDCANLETVYAERATRDAYDRGAAVKAAGLPWTSLGRYELRAKGPGVVVPMDMLRDITGSGVVGDATRARLETGERIIAALVPRIVQVCKEMAGKE